MTNSTAPLVLIDETAVKLISEMMYADCQKEAGGQLLGTVLRNNIGAIVMYRISEVFVHPPTTASNSSFTFTNENYLACRRYAQEVGLSILGTVHSHGVFPAFISPVDNTFYRRLDAPKDAVHIIVSPSHGNTTVCVTTSRDETGYTTITPATLCCASESIDFSIISAAPGDKSSIPKRFRKLSRIFFARGKPSAEAEKELSIRRFHDRTKGHRVCVIGVGTLGGFLLQLLVMSGSYDSITIIDPDVVSYGNLNSSLYESKDIGKPKVFSAAESILPLCRYPTEITAIQATAESLGTSFYRDFSLILSPVDNKPTRHWLSWVCKINGIHHISLGTGTNVRNGRLLQTANVLVFPSKGSCDLDSIWGKSYLQELEVRKSCSDAPVEIAQQTAIFAAKVASQTACLADRLLSGEMDDETTLVYHLSDTTGKYKEDKSCSCYLQRFGSVGGNDEVLAARDPANPIPSIKLSRNSSHALLHHLLSEALDKPDADVFTVDFERSMVFDVAYSKNNALSSMVVECTEEITPEVFARLPDASVYCIEYEGTYHLVEITFEN